MRKNNKRSAILDAALQVVEEKGARHLTIDAVAEQSGMSKGGVLYHFASKDALLSGMLAHLIELNMNRVNERRRTEPGENQITAILEARARMTSTERRASLAILAAAAENAELLEPVHDFYAQAFNDAVGSTENRMAATVLMLASEGLRFLDVLGVNPLSGKHGKDVVAYLHQQAEGL